MPNKQIQSLTVEGVTYDIVDNTSGYINAQYIENKTDYSIPVSRAGEIIAGETAIGTDSTNFPTSKAVVDYVDERVVQEIEAIDIPTVPTKTSDLTNDSGYLTASDIASVMTYKGTKANYAALPSTGNTTGDVWHLTDTGAEWAWDGSAWQELGTAIDLSNYATKATTLAGYGITDAKIQNGTITLGSNTITPLTSFTETDPVFSASAAAGITSTDISNWNAKSSTDNKVLQQLSTNNNSFCVLLRQNTGTTFSTDGTLFSANFTVQPSTGNITVGKVNNYTLAAACAKSVDVSITASSSSTNLPTSAAVANFVENKGYLTLATLPIYDGTVV